MRVYAILAHDKKDSLNSFIFNNITDHLKTKINIEVDILNLYDHAVQIPFYSHDQKVLENNPFFQENKKRFMAADRILLVHPIYWYSTPGILKSWFDLITNYAYKYKKNHPYAKALHKIKKTLTVNSSMAPLWFRKHITSNPAQKQVKSSFRWFGIRQNLFYEIGNTEEITDEQVKVHVQKILIMADKLVS